MNTTSAMRHGLGRARVSTDRDHGTTNSNHTRKRQGRPRAAASFLAALAVAVAWPPAGDATADLAAPYRPMTNQSISVGDAEELEATPMWTPGTDDAPAPKPDVPVAAPIDQPAAPAIEPPPRAPSTTPLPCPAPAETAAVEPPESAAALLDTMMAETAAPFVVPLTPIAPVALAPMSDGPDGATPAIGTIAPAQPAAQEFTVKFRRDAVRPERLRLTKDKGVVMELNRPISRASIAQPEIADVAVLSPTELVLTGKEFGTTQLILWTSDDQQRIFDVLVEIDLPLLEELIKNISPTSQVKVRSLINTVVLTGSVPDPLTSERIGEIAELFSPGRVKNQLSVAGVQQVLIRCTVAEMNRSAMRELGMNWFLGGNSLSRDFFFANNLNSINPSTVQDSGLLNLLQGERTFSLLPNVNLSPNTNITLGFPRAELQFFIQAMRENGLVRVLAEPNVIAISGQKASFLAGGEIPIPIAQDQNTISVDYKEFGVRLEFTPYVVGGQMIRMNVLPEVSDVDATRQVVVAGFVIPAFTTRRAESTVEVGNGQTFALAGLLNESVRAAAQRIPGIGDVPIIGTLFSSVQYMKNETELIILITPELVAPLDPQQVPPVPGQLVTEPSDYDLFLNGRIEGESTLAPETEGAPRHDLPPNVFMHDSAWVSSTMSTGLQGPYGMAFGEEEAR